MNRFIASVIILFSFIVIPALAFSEDLDRYFKVGLTYSPVASQFIESGSVDLAKDTDDQYGGVFTLGGRKDMGDGIGMRGEIEFSYTKRDGTGAGSEFRASDYSIFLNMLSDMELAPGILAYGGGGVGLMNSRISLTSGGKAVESEYDTDLAYQVIAGVEMSKILGPAGLYAEYNYIRVESDFENSAEIPVSYGMEDDHRFEAGIKIDW